MTLLDGNRSANAGGWNASSQRTRAGGVRAWLNRLSGHEPLSVDAAGNPRRPTSTSPPIPPLWLDNSVCANASRSTQEPTHDGRTPYPPCKRSCAHCPQHPGRSIAFQTGDVLCPILYPKRCRASEPSAECTRGHLATHKQLRVRAASLIGPSDPTCTMVTETSRYTPRVSPAAHVSTLARASLATLSPTCLTLRRHKTLSLEAITPS